MLNLRVAYARSGKCGGGGGSVGRSSTSIRSSSVGRSSERAKFGSSNGRSSSRAKLSSSVGRSSSRVHFTPGKFQGGFYRTSSRISAPRTNRKTAPLGK